MDKESTASIHSISERYMRRAAELAPEDYRVSVYQVAADHLTSMYIQTSIEWGNYQLALTALRAALGIPTRREDQQSGS